ncbi:hypothetical protein [Pelomonas sp. KK5]|uniref:hypothetical protein n=1 Tax=Pelomonas sp. KK5 TaxID=1855730 RepID=UPI00097C5DEC|nr:hypothetical protein [Pelomonas sp. KK5]
MPLTEHQRAFVSQFLKVGFRAKSKNEKILGAFEAYADLESRFKVLAAEIPRDQDPMPALISGLTPVLAHKNAGRFAEATEGFKPLVRDAEALKLRVAEQRKQLRARLEQLVEPTNAVDPELTQMGQLRVKILELLVPALPSKAAAGEAGTKLDELQQLIDKSLKAWKEAGAEALKNLAVPTKGSGPDKDTLAKLREQITSLQGKTRPSREEQAAANAALERLKRLTTDLGKGIAVRDSDSVDALKSSGRVKTAAKAQLLLEQVGGALGDTEVTPELVSQADTAIAEAKQKRQQALDALDEINKRTVTNPQQQQQMLRDREANRLKREEADAAIAAANKRRNQIAARQLLPNMLAGGPLSSEARGPLDDDDMEKLVGAYGKDARLADQVVSDIGSASHPKAVAGHLDQLCDMSASGFASSGGTAFTNPDYARSYAANILKQGGSIGEEAFSGLDDYVRAGEQFKPNPLENPVPGTFGELTQVRTRSLAKGMVGDDGQINPTAGKLAVQHLLFHPKVLGNPTPELARNAVQTLKLFTDPGTKAGVQQVLDGANASANDPSANQLVKGALGMGTSDVVGDKDVKHAIVSAMFAPLTQGPVGSCFSTAPCRRQREIDPLATMKSYTELATKGKLTPSNGVPPVPAVTRLPDHENPLMRSLEYTLASAAARAPGSDRGGKFSRALQSGVDALRPEGTAGGTAWNARKGKLIQDVTKALTWVYDPLIKTAPSSDGSSSQGRYVVRRVSDGKEISTKEAFISVITDIVLAELQKDDPSLERSAIEAKVSAPAFLDQVCAGNYKPWELSSGGYDKEIMQAMGGGTVNVKPMLGVGNGTQSEGERTTAILGNLLGSFQGRGDKMAIIKTETQHTFNALPNDPSLAPLKGSNPTETAQKLKDKLVDPGKRISETALSTERAVFLYEQQLKGKLAAEKVDELKELLKTALAAKPTKAMTPAQLDKALTDALAPYQARKSALDTEAWVTQQTTAGKTVDTVAKDKYAVERLANLKKWQAGDNQDLLVKATGAPEFAIADSNWGDGTNFIQFVIAPDPRTGEPLLFKKTLPPGKLSPLGREWTDKAWSMVE